MERPSSRETSRRTNRNHATFGPVVWIVMLLACWLVIAKWDVLPEAIRQAMAVLS